MANSAELKRTIPGSPFQEKLQKIYLGKSVLAHESERYLSAVDKFVELYGDGDLSIYSAPGRTEVCGNHTDHQHGKVLAASLNLDVIAVVKKTEDQRICIKSEGFPEDQVDISVLEPVSEEEGTSASLIRGVVAWFKDRGYEIGGFDAYTTSQVLKGSGMSSSAAFEVLVGTILSGLYNDMKVDSVQIAIASQYAENVFFGKPSGLMDQMACSVGGMISIDFKDPANPVIHQLDTDFSQFGYALCITDTKGSHADLTEDYAAIPQEMKQVASYFGKEFLRDVDEAKFFSAIPKLRETCGDRPVLRAMHFFAEEQRVDSQVRSLESGDFDSFLKGEQSSGNSSFKYLQNVTSPKREREQNIPVALSVSDLVLQDRGASRVHGGGFAGTIQAFVPHDLVTAYQEALDSVFGEGSCHVLQIRKYGGMKVTE